MSVASLLIWRIQFPMLLVKGTHKTQVQPTLRFSTRWCPSGWTALSSSSSWAVNTSCLRLPNCTVPKQKIHSSRKRAKLRITWPGSGLQDQVWKQTSNPATKYHVSGYAALLIRVCILALLNSERALVASACLAQAAINAPHHRNSWGGLRRENRHTLMDGTNGGNWCLSPFFFLWSLVCQPG